MSAAAFDSTGFAFGTSFSNSNTSGADDDCHKFTWGSLGLFGRNNQSPTWYIDYEVDIGVLNWQAKKLPTTYHPADGHGARCVPTGNVVYRNTGGGSALSIEGRIMFNKKPSIFELGAGFGLAGLSGMDDIYHLTKDGFYGLITGRIRLPITNRFGLDVEADHISSVFGQDRGMNVWKIGTYLMF